MIAALLQSWPSLSGDAIVTAGYVLAGRRWPYSWVLTAGANAMLGITGVVDLLQGGHQWALLWAFALMGVSVWNVARWRQPNPAILRLERDLASAQARLAELEGGVA